MTDFSKTNIHCSSIGAVMSPGREKTPKQKYEDAVSKLNYWNSKYEPLDEKKRLQAGGKKIQTKVEYWEGQLLTLEQFKDLEPLSKGAKSHLKRVYGYSKYGKWSAAVDKGTKYTNKGLLAEQDSIDLVNRLQGGEMIKNEERVNNDFLTGIPDLFKGDNIYNADYIIDIKTSWDIETFLDNLGKPLNSCYWWQIQGYLAITGAKYGEVSYCLVNTPESLLNHERFKLKERMDNVTDESPEYKAKEMELVNNMTFNDIPEKERRLRFLVERDDEAIGEVYKKVIECRKYLSEIEELHLQGVFLAKELTEDDEIEENADESE